MPDRNTTQPTSNSTCNSVSSDINALLKHINIDQPEKKHTKITLTGESSFPYLFRH